MINIKRVFDLLICIPLLLLIIIPMIFIGLLIRISSIGPILYWSSRVGYKGKIFLMPKYRTMHINTPELATDKLENPGNFITPIGKILRKTSLDELPQLFSVIKGDMSLVGPRPALYNQKELIILRSHHGTDQLIPGLTGWAQVNGRDNLSIEEKAAFDKEYLSKKSIYFDIYILIITIFRVLAKNNVSH